MKDVLLGGWGRFEVEVAGGQFCFAVFDRCGHLGAACSDDVVELGAQRVGGLLELGHAVAPERIRVRERGPDGLVATGGQVVEVTAVFGQQCRSVVVDGPLRSLRNDWIGSMTFSLASSNSSPMGRSR